MKVRKLKPGMFFKQNALCIGSKAILVLGVEKLGERHPYYVITTIDEKTRIIKYENSPDDLFLWYGTWRLVK